MKVALKLPHAPQIRFARDYGDSPAAIHVPRGTLQLEQ
jgi:hypothetical protein